VRLSIKNLHPMSFANIKPPSRGREGTENGEDSIHEESDDLTAPISVGYVSEFHHNVMAKRKEIWTYIKQKTRTVPKDFVFTALFVIQIVMVLIMALSFGVTALTANSTNIVVTVVGDPPKESSVNAGDGFKLFGGILLTVTTGALLSSGWIWLMGFYVQDIIITSFVIAILVCIFGGISLFISGEIVGGIFLTIGAVAVTLLFIYLRPRLGFASTTLKLACAIIKAMPATVFYSYIVLLLQISYCILWALAVLGVATNEASANYISGGGKTFHLSQCATYRYSNVIPLPGGSYLDCGSVGGSCQACVCDGGTVVSNNNTPCFTASLNSGAYFGLSLCLLWTCSVLSNVVHTTVAGVVASWWAQSDDASSASHNIVRINFQRAIWECLGSICMGSLIVSSIRATRTVLYFTTEKLRLLDKSLTAATSGSTSNPTVTRIKVAFFSILEYSLHILDRAFTFFNRYAFTYVAVYDYSFMDASRAVSSLFLQRGWTAIVNDDIVDTILFLGQIIIAVVSSLVGYAYSIQVGCNLTNLYQITMLGFLAGYLFAVVTLKCISSAVATVYVSFAEAPDSLERYHPEHYHELRGAWNCIYGLGGGGGGGGGGGASSTMKGAYTPPLSQSKGIYNQLPIIDEEESVTILGQQHNGSNEESVTF